MISRFTPNCEWSHQLTRLWSRRERVSHRPHSSPRASIPTENASLVPIVAPGACQPQLSVSPCEDRSRGKSLVSIHSTFSMGMIPLPTRDIDIQLLFVPCHIFLLFSHSFLFSRRLASPSLFPSFLSSSHSLFTCSTIASTLRSLIQHLRSSLFPTLLQHHRFLHLAPSSIISAYCHHDSLYSHFAGRTCRGSHGHGYCRLPHRQLRPRVQESRSFLRQEVGSDQHRQHIRIDCPA